MLMFELLQGVSFDDLVNVSGFQIFYLILWFACFVLYRIFLCLTVNASAKEKQVKCRSIWSLLTFLFGVIVAIVYAIVNHKHKDAKRYKSKNVFLVLSIILIVLSYIGGICYNLSNTGRFGLMLNPQISFDDSKVVYENDRGKEIVYDKMGNEYTYGQYANSNGFKYYDENGNIYKWADETRDTLASEDGKRYKMEDYAFFVNQNGYICIFDVRDISDIDDLNIHYYGNSVYYDDSGNLYYDGIDLVSWDKDGNIVFPSIVREWMKISYDDIIK